MKITQNTTLEKILALPQAEKVLSKYKVPCLTCPMAKYEMAGLKIGDVCKIYGINEKELLKELNKI
ncbi:hypothetical protein FJ208_01155 [Candidatus Gribaldobacteria bacterium]|nr:hypothetical protein [Candidatus Gribaldobacteria bacterium]